MPITPHERSWQDADSGHDLLRQNVEALQSSLSALDLSELEKAAELLDDRCLQGNTVYCVGNGGSAATAAHLATDMFFGRRLSGELRPRAISLVSNVPLVTALANDVGYENVFVEQLNGLFNKGDVVIGISASGNSENVLRAVDFAKANDGSAVGLVGFDGGNLKKRCDISVHVPTPVGAYELVEDVHHSICHMLANYLKFKAKQRQSTEKSSRR